MKKFSYIFFACVIGLLVYFFSGAPFAIVFQNAVLNYWFKSLLFFSLPISLLLVIIYSEHILIRPLAIIFLIITILPFTALSLMGYLDSRDIRIDGSDPSFERIDEIETNIGFYRLYLGNCGATCSWNMVLNKEIDLPIGMKIIVEKWSTEHESAAKFVETDSTIQIVRTILDERILTEIPK